MNKLIVLLLTIIFLGAGAVTSYASDWDKAGKVLTVIDGMRFITGGKIDLMGTLIGETTGKLVKNDRYETRRPHHGYPRYAKRHVRCTEERIWVPHHEWRTKHVPAHETYDDELGTIRVSAHEIEYKVETGGHWKTEEYCH